MPKRAASPSEDGQGLTREADAKRTRIDLGPHAVVDDAIPYASQFEGIRTAFDIRRAIADRESIPSIGRCVLREKDWKDERADSEDEEEAENYLPKKVEEDESTLAERKAAAATVNELREVVAKHRKDVAQGHLDNPLSIKFSLPNYKSECILQLSKNENRDKTIREATENRIKTWMEHGDVSPFGDMRENVTRIDETVRVAREIRAEHFTVETDLIHEVEEIWAENFVPSRVIARPYKINMYGPDGMFKPHRDTPEKDLVGTFLIGLGNTSSSRFNAHLRLYPGNFAKRCSVDAHVGEWAAFYPDVPHEVKKLDNGYRATLAFKIYRDVEHSSGGLDDEDNAPIQGILSELKPPFGLVLDHKYCFGTTSLSGVDALLLASVKTRPNPKLLVLPIFMEQNATKLYPTRENDLIWDRERTTTFVRPFTAAVVNTLLAGASDSAGAILSAQWPWRSIPFYEMSDESMLTWESKSKEINHTGNESDGSRSDSLYFSFALLCLGENDEIPQL